MYFRYTLLKTSGDQVLEIFPVGINISFMNHAPYILYSEAESVDTFDRLIESLKAYPSKTYSKLVKYGEKAKIVLYKPEQTKTSYSSSYSDRVEQAQVVNLNEIQKYSWNLEVFRCYIFDIKTNCWYERRYTQELVSSGRIESPIKQILLF